MLPEEDENLEERWFSGYEFRLYEVEIRVNPVLSSLANFFAIYVIVRHSPSHMTTYRWFLLNIVVCSWIWDLHSTLLFAPVPLLPAPGVCVLGFLRYLGDWGVLISFIMFHMVGACGASVLCAAAFRLAAVLNVTAKLTSKTAIIAMVVLHNVIVLPVYIAFSRVLPIILQNQRAYVQLAKKYEGIENVTKKYTCTFASFEEVSYKATVINTILNLMIGSMAAACMFVACGWVLWSRRAKMSVKTFRLHRNLLISLVVQMVVPLATLVGPALVIAFAVYLESPLLKCEPTGVSRAP